MYGLEGKKQNYQPWQCSKILSQMQPGQDEHHGCPFKNFSEMELMKLIKSYGVDLEKAKLISKKARFEK